MRRVLSSWLAAVRRGYRHSVTHVPDGALVAPLPRPSELDRFEGMWVAVVDDEVVAAEHTSHKLALKLHTMDHRKRDRATVEYVRPTGDSYIVGVG